MTRRSIAGLVALCAIGLAGLWLVGIVSIFDADYNRKAEPEAMLLGAQTIIGALGIVSLLSAAFCVIQCLRPHAGNPVKRAVSAALVALSLFALWFYLALAAAAS